MTSNPELLLAAQLEQAHIPFTREYHFASKEWSKANGFLTPTGRGKDWRADFKVDAWQSGHGFPELPFMYRPVLVEVEGGAFTGGHRRGAAYDQDTERASAAAILGYRVIRCTPRQVDDGSALSWIQKALGLREKP